MQIVLFMCVYVLLQKQKHRTHKPEINENSYLYTEWKQDKRRDGNKICE